RRRDRRAYARRRHPPRPARGHLPEVVRVRADLPPRARAAGPRGRGRRGGGGPGRMTAAVTNTPEQQAAIDTRDREVLLEAGAGTGKTTVLVGRYCDALIDDGAGVDEILAFTFTDRAAAQLRDRIRRELRERGEQRLARETEGAWITTIHGFCN